MGIKEMFDDAMSMFFTTPIAISKTIPYHRRHAVLFVQTKEGGQFSYGVRADRPQLLRKPTRVTLKDIFEQVEKMDLIPISLNVTIDGLNDCYSVRDVFPEMAAQYGQP